MLGLPVFDLDALRAHEAAHADLGLMERAGLAAATWLLQRDLTFQSALVVAGPGNNGGDAYVVARHLHAAGKFVLVIGLAPPGDHAPDAQAARDALKAAGVEIHLALPDVAEHFDWVIDGIFGIGLNRPPDARYADAIEHINRRRSPHTGVLAIDVPSGVDALTGDVYFPSVVADATLTFLAHKAGLWTGAALDYLGELVLLDLDLPAPDAPTDALVVTWAHVVRGLPVRLRTAHKGSSGSVMIVGGADGMVGAALLAGRAAQRAGAGKVLVGFAAETVPLVDVMFPELMLEPFSSFKANVEAVVVGPGLSTSSRAKDIVVRALNLPQPLVLDADALNIIASDFGLRDRLRDRTAPTTVTPHPGEAARMLNITVEQVNADRISSARMLSERFRANVVLKGAGSVCVSVTGATNIAAAGNPLLATAGSGDVLAGMLGALIAQGLQPFTALVMAVCWHGHLAERMAARGVQRATASDLIEELKFTSA